VVSQYQGERYYLLVSFCTSIHFGNCFLFVWSISYLHYIGRGDTLWHLGLRFNWTASTTLSTASVPSRQGTEIHFHASKAIIFVKGLALGTSRRLFDVNSGPNYCSSWKLSSIILLHAFLLARVCLWTIVYPDRIPCVLTSLLNGRFQSLIWCSSCILGILTLSASGFQPWWSQPVGSWTCCCCRLCWARSWVLARSTNRCRGRGIQWMGWRGMQADRIRRMTGVDRLLQLRRSCTWGNSIRPILFPIQLGSLVHLKLDCGQRWH